MSIEPSQAYTVCIRAPMPPKEEPKAIVPTMSYHADARLIRKRHCRAWGVAGSADGSQEANMRRKQQAIVEREAMAAMTMEALRVEPHSTAELTLKFSSSQNKVSTAIGLLRSRNLIDSLRKGLSRRWRIVEATE